MSLRNWAESPPKDFSEGCAYRTAMEIRRVRTEIWKVSAQRMADYCTELGVPMTRAIIADLESGRRRFVSTSELIIFAEVLVISPFQLMFGPDATDIETIPGLKRSRRSREQTQLWFSGLNDTNMRSARDQVTTRMNEARAAALDILKLTDGLELPAAEELVRPDHTPSRRPYVSRPSDPPPRKSRQLIDKARSAKG